MLRKNSSKEVDIKKINDILGLSKKILKIAYLLIIIACIYAITLVFKEWKIMNFIFTVIKILSPLFIGLIIAWLFDPVVSFLKRKGMKRVIGAALTYVVIMGILAIIIGTIIPMLSSQVNELVKTLPNILDVMRTWIDAFFEKLSNIEGFNAIAFKEDLFDKLENVGFGITNALPDMVINGARSIISGIGIIIVGLIIGFFLLVSFDSADDLITFLPKKYHKDARDLTNEINTSLRTWVTGAILDCTFIFIITSVGLAIVGLKAPLLFGLFCGITNIIPYAGPYIGGIPAVLVGFAQDPMTGLFTLIVIFIIQFLEGNLLQPLIMSKTTKLHPVTIIIGLLICGYFLGIVGMIIATPLIAAIKTIIIYFDEKYDFLNNN